MFFIHVKLHGTNEPQASDRNSYTHRQRLSVATIQREEDITFTSTHTHIVALLQPFMASFANFILASRATTIKFGSRYNETRGISLQAVNCITFDSANVGRSKGVVDVEQSR